MSTEEIPSPAPDAAPGTPPSSEGGQTWIADQIVAKIASAAAREVEGVDELRGGSMRRGWVRASDRRQGGAGVKIEDGRAAIELRLVVHDGVAIPAVVEAVRERVTERVEFGTGLAVSKVDIGVVDVVPAPDPEPADAPVAEAPAESG